MKASSQIQSSVHDVLNELFWGFVLLTRTLCYGNSAPLYQKMRLSVYPFSNVSLIPLSSLAIRMIVQNLVAAMCSSAFLASLHYWWKIVGYDWSTTCEKYQENNYREEKHDSGDKEGNYLRKTLPCITVLHWMSFLVFWAEDQKSFSMQDFYIQAKYRKPFCHDVYVL